MLLIVAMSLALPLATAPAAAAPDGQITWAIHITIAPTWLDPAEHPGVITLKAR